MITPTSLNEAFLAKVRVAAREAIRNAATFQLDQLQPNGQAYVTNRRGRLMMRVDFEVGRSPAFRFWEGSRKDITPMVIKAMGGSL